MATVITTTGYAIYATDVCYGVGATLEAAWEEAKSNLGAVFSTTRRDEHGNWIEADVDDVTTENMNEYGFEAFEATAAALADIDADPDSGNTVRARGIVMTDEEYELTTKAEA